MVKAFDKPSVVYGELAVTAGLLVAGSVLFGLEMTKKHKHNRAIEVAAAVTLASAVLVGIHPSFKARKLNMATGYAVAADTMVMAGVTLMTTLMCSSTLIDPKMKSKSGISYATILF